MIQMHPARQALTPSHTTQSRSTSPCYYNGYDISSCSPCAMRSFERVPRIGGEPVRPGGHLGERVLPSCAMVPARYDDDAHAASHVCTCMPFLVACQWPGRCCTMGKDAAQESVLSATGHHVYTIHLLPRNALTNHSTTLNDSCIYCCVVVCAPGHFMRLSWIFLLARERTGGAMHTPDSTRAVRYLARRFRKHECVLTHPASESMCTNFWWWCPDRAGDGRCQMVRVGKVSARGAEPACSWELVATVGGMDHSIVRPGQ